jgi:hypothetical protein
MSRPKVTRKRDAASCWRTDNVFISKRVAKRTGEPIASIFFGNFAELLGKIQ